jgi:hypothetical protein
VTYVSQLSDIRNSKTLIFLHRHHHHRSSSLHTEYTQHYTRKVEREKQKLFWTMSPALAASKAAAAAASTAAAATASSSCSNTSIRKAYRELAHIIRQFPDAAKRASSMQELRSQFKAPLKQGGGSDAEEEAELQARLKQALDRAAFLKITTVKSKPRQGDAGRWLYKNGQRLNVNDAEAQPSLRQGHHSRVVSNWDGKNLDPQSVSTHRKQLHRSGFVNNLHAKGLF